MNRNHTHEESWLAQVADAFERQAIPARPDDEALLAELVARDAAESAAPRWQYQLWRYWNTRTARGLLAAAAVVAVTLVMTGIFLPRGLSPQEAFAQAVANVQRVSMATMHMTVTNPGQKPFEVTVYLKNPGSMRQEFTWGLVNVYDYAAGRLLTLMKNPDRAVISPLAAHVMGEGPDGIVDGFKHLNADRAVLVEETKTDGRSLLVYDVNDANLTMRVWVDKQTLLPTQMRTTTTLSGQDQPSVMTLDRIDWDAQLDDALFTLDVPAGYELVQAEMGEPGPADLTRLLRLWTALTDGAFPEQLHPMNLYQVGGLFKTFEARVKREGRDPATAYAAVAQALGMDIERMTPDSRPMFEQLLNTALGRGASYLATRLSSDWHWVGKGATLGDADRIVCYWQSEDGAHYRALNAKLELLTLTRDQLPPAE